ncbi:hypothetical protein [Roseobacter sp. TSBP12]|uniref:hypothetical protein n=1 Tax=Roseobacter sp. TSBP12 TaxID=1236613 RepID=UPI00125F9295|nr:hypothetical protein [Roseobacter sp. TSBP12]KAB6716273.1 hypothetical protein C8029_10345 [Roseobacter sp. TSBP12]
MTVIDWPLDINGRIEGSPFLSMTSVTAGPGLDGDEQIVGRENGVWEVKITTGKLIRETIPVWRAFIHSLRGRQNPFRFKVWNSFALPISGPIPDGGICIVAADAPAGSTIINLSGYSGENINPGGYFSINDFLYEVQSNASGVVSFLPPLRMSVAVGDEVKISGPTILLRLSNDSDGRAYPTGMRYAAPVTFTAKEVFQR